MRVSYVISDEETRNLVSYLYSYQPSVHELHALGGPDGEAVPIDSLVITRNGNQLKTIEDHAVKQLTYTGTSDFYDGCTYNNEYSYNENGALDMDLNRDIDMIEYDQLGNMRNIFFYDHSNIEYIYAADGTKLRTIHRPASSSSLTDSIDYIGNLILKNGQPSMYLFDGGYASFGTNGVVNGRHYYIQDYMGNNRMVINKNGTVEQVTHYYPYGGVIGGISTNGTWQNNKFEGKELDRTFGLDNYDIHARQYFAMMPSWDRIDPLAEDNPQFSPYSYCMGNSVNFGDYNGMNPIFDENGIYLGDTKEGFTGEILVVKGMNFDINKANEMTVEELLDIYNPDFSVSLGIFWLKPSGLENVWNTILEHFDGEPLDDNIRFSVAHLGRVKYDLDKTSGSKGGGDYAGWKTYPDGNTYGSSGYPYETTVENIAAALLLHEYYGHTVKKWGDSQNNHYKCYEAIKKFRLYDKTTKSFKDKTEEGINKR